MYLVNRATCRFYTNFYYISLLYSRSEYRGAVTPCMQGNGNISRAMSSGGRDDLRGASVPKEQRRKALRANVYKRVDILGDLLSHGLPQSLQNPCLDFLDNSRHESFYQTSASGWDPNVQNVTRSCPCGAMDGQDLVSIWKVHRLTLVPVQWHLDLNKLLLLALGSFSHHHSYCRRVQKTFVG